MFPKALSQSHCAGPVLSAYCRTVFCGQVPSRGDELGRLYSELHTVSLLLNAEEPPVPVGGFSAVSPGEAVGLREETLEAMAAAVENIGVPDFDN